LSVDRAVDSADREIVSNRSIGSTLKGEI
jgi:hypothetical protein